MNLPEAEVAGTNNSEAEFTARLAAYRTANTEETTVLNYFGRLWWWPHMGVALISLSLSLSPPPPSSRPRLHMHTQTHARPPA